MKIFLYIIMALAIQISATSAFAVGGCPQAADRLEDFAGCLVPTRGAVGMRYSAAVAANIDEGNLATLAALQKPILPVQQIGSLNGIISPMYGFYPMIGMAYAAGYYRNPTPLNYWTLQFILTH